MNVRAAADVALSVALAAIGVMALMLIVNARAALAITARQKRDVTVRRQPKLSAEVERF